MQLYHYCCSCSARRITSRGFLRPFGGALFGVDLIWLTDQVTPNREGLGLTSQILKCDRLEHQYVVEAAAGGVERWLSSDVRRIFKTKDYDGNFDDFEAGRSPETWWIARRPLFAVRNRSYEHQTRFAGAPFQISE